jgi:hypothetical protein
MLGDVKKHVEGCWKKDILFFQVTGDTRKHNKGIKKDAKGHYTHRDKVNMNLCPYPNNYYQYIKKSVSKKKTHHTQGHQEGL